MKPSSAAYQKHRKDTLRGIDRQRFLSVGLELAKQNRKKGAHYSRRIMKTLRGGHV